MHNPCSAFCVDPWTLYHCESCSSPTKPPPEKYISLLKLWTRGTFLHKSNGTTLLQAHLRCSFSSSYWHQSSPILKEWKRIWDNIVSWADLITLWRAHLILFWAHLISLWAHLFSLWAPLITLCAHHIMSSSHYELITLWAHHIMSSPHHMSSCANSANASHH